MASCISRLVACLVGVVAVLQLIHLVLLNKLESRRLTSELSYHEQISAASGGGIDGGIVHYRKSDHFSPNNHNNYQGDDPSIINGKHGRRYGPGQKPNLDKMDKMDVEAELDELYKLIVEEDGSILDSRGEYRIVFDLIGPKSDGVLLPEGSINPGGTNGKFADGGDFSIDEFESLPEVPDVTLVSQSDIRNAKFFLLPLVERWDGPLSLSIFASNSSEVEEILEFIAQSRACHEPSRSYITYHLIFPLVEGLQGSRNRTRLISSALKNSKKPRKISQECQNFYQNLPSTTSETPWLDVGTNYESQYPINLLRNVARKKVQTEFAFVCDIDMIPSQDLRIKFQRFARDKGLLKLDGNERKSVFVVPAFESKNGETPRNKVELLKLIEKYQIRPFYFDLCWKCQVHTDYETWQRESPSKNDQLSILFEVLWKDPWEPFFISENDPVPLFDERFKQFGFNRLSQLCELHIAGYKFAVLNDAFLIHRGFKTHQSFHQRKNQDSETNRLHFRQFKSELKDKYPVSTRVCY